MLEKIGLPPKPSQRGNNWVVDASHCQGCSSQFSFINRKHHCRRCGGIFCGSCTSQRMVLRGQGDSPVRICEPCKQLEEAARFEMRYGNRSRVGKASSKSSLKSDDEIVSEGLGSTRKESLASGSGSSSKIVSRIQRATSQNAGESTSLSSRSTSLDEFSHEVSEKEPTSPEDLRRQAVEEKEKYKILKGQGKSDEALRSFKRGKELERQADALEISLRRNRRKSVLSRNVEEVQTKDETGGSRRGNKASRVEGKEKDDLMAELRELGWSDMDLHNEDKKGTTGTLEGGLSSLLGEVSENTKKEKGGNNPMNNSQVLAHKKKALALKREGNLAEAKEELKKAKVLEKKLEEQELLGAAEDSDDELSVLIHSMGGDDKQELSSNLFGQGNDFDLSSLIGAVDRIVDGNFEVTDEDMEDPEIAAALESLGWAGDTDVHESTVPQMVSIDKEALSNEILSLKREALTQKRAGNVSEAMTLLRKAKLLEKDLESLDSSQSATLHIVSHDENVSTAKNMDSKPATRKSKLMIQRELLGLKKNALALKREGRFDEAEEELKKGKILEQQLEDMDKSPLNVKPLPVAASTQVPDLAYDNLVVENEEVENVSDQDMSDPTYLSILKNLGWQEEHTDHVARVSSESSASLPIDEPSISQAAPAVGRPRKSKAELQRELLGLKRKALALRRRGENEESEELLTRAQDIEAQISEMEHPIKEVQLEISAQNENPRQSEDEAEDVTEKDRHDPAMLSILKSLGWNDKGQETMAGGGKHDETSAMPIHSDATSVTQTSVAVKRSKGEIQRELLNLKRKAFALRRKGETEEAEEVQNMAKVLEAQIEELEAPKRVNLQESVNEEKPLHFGSLSNQEERENEIDDKDLKFGAVSEMTNRGMMSSDLLIPLNAPLVESTAVTVPPLADSGNLIDLLTGGDWSGSQMLAEKHENLVILDKKPHSLESNTVERDEKAHDSKSHLAEKHGPPSDEMALKQDILARKRKAVALKREGKLVEAREELREAKLLEKRLLPQVDANSATAVAHEPVPTTSNASSPSDGQMEPALSSTISAKPLSSRERFKLQQKSLAHKRQALKLRREGRTEEADAELELARSLEAQLEESSGHDSNSSADATGAANDMGVEDFLDPQLLSALRAIGIADAGVAPRILVRDTPQPSKPSVSASENPQQERIQLQEKIKAEKVKAVNLKRSGNQAEALEAFRKAKLMEKKLNSLTLPS